ncbi:putative membrane protein YczE [Nocardia alba]|uniref:Putative membrane protein YczE n=2 Tax=Nocardia alba TaxID=225051 RepID=A0A4R1FZZ1_9NOCA|nr:putative membrane protein YczE [Nocardia alba]
MVPMLTRRLVALYVGLWLYGTSMAVMIRAGLGLDPWDVFHQGVASHVPLSFGVVTALTGLAVLLAWIPLRQRPGLGTVSNVVVIAIAVDAGLWLIPAMDGLWLRALGMVAAVVVNAAATVLYIGAGMGPGPRDGLMTGLVARTGWPIWSVRTGIEVSVLTTGWFLGGSVGIGTLVYAFGIGPLVQLMIPFVDGKLPGFTPRTRHDKAPSAPRPQAPAAPG